MKESEAARIFGVATWVVLGILLVSAVLLQGRLISSLDFDGENMVAEGEAFQALRSVIVGETLYRDFSKTLHIEALYIAQYMPLFYLVPGLVAKAAGADVLTAVFISRSFTYLFWLGSGVVIYALARQSGCARHLAAVGMLLWLAGRLALQWADSYRPDSAAIFFSLAAIWLYGRARGYLATVSVVGLLVIAFLYKQSAVAALFVLVFEEIKLREWWRAVILLGVWVAAVALTFWIGQALTHGAFVLNTWGTLAVLSHATQPLDRLEGAAYLGLPAFSGAALACATVPSTQCPVRLKVYFVVGLFLAFVTSAKTGAAVNYYLEPLAVGCVLTSLWLHQRQTHPLTRTTTWIALGWIAVALSWSAQALAHRAVRFPTLIREIAGHRSIRERQAQCWSQVIASIAELGEPVLSEDPYLAARLGTKPLLMMQAGNFAEMKRGGRFNDAELLRRIEAGTFKAIVAIHPLNASVAERGYDARWINLMLERYIFVRSYSIDHGGITLYIYRPRE